MKIKKFIKPLLISTLILGSLSLATTQVNAQHVQAHHSQVSRTFKRIHRYKRPIQRIHYRRIHPSRRIKHSQIHLINRHKAQQHQIHKHKYLGKNQKKSAKTNSNRRFITVNNHTRDLSNAHWESWGNYRRMTVKSYAGPKAQFKTLRFLPLHVGGTHFVQSIAVTPSGHYAFIGCDAFPYLSGYTKIARVNLQKKSGGIKVGPRFYGGHGQALAYNPKNNQLWLLVDPSGPLSQGNFKQISTNSLKPIKTVKFNLHNKYLGDVLTFDNQGNAYNENRIWSWDTTRQYKQGNIILYKGTLNRHSAKFNEIRQGIRRAPGYIIQGIAYNNRTKRLYIETDDAIMSIPENKLGKLKPKNVKETILHGHREYEGISFDKSGHAYIVMARPNEILKSTKVF